MQCFKDLVTLSFQSQGIFAGVGSGQTVTGREMVSKQDSLSHQKHRNFCRKWRRFQRINVILEEDEHFLLTECMWVSLTLLLFSNCHAHWVINKGTCTILPNFENFLLSALQASL